MLRSFDCARAPPAADAAAALGADRASASCSASGWSSASCCSSGTIRATFDELIDSRLGQDRPDRHRARAAARCPSDTLDDDQGGRRAFATRPGMVGGMFTRLERGRQPGQGPQGPDAGRRLRARRATSPTTSAGRGAPDRAPAARSMVEQNWARERGFDVGDRVPRRRRRPAARELPIVGIFKLTSSLNVGGYGYAAMPLAGARGELFDQPSGWMQISVVADDRGHGRRAQAARRARARPRRATCRRPGEVSDEIAEQLAGAQHRPLLLLRASRCSSAAS